MLLASISSSTQPLLASSAVNVDLDPTLVMHFIFFTAFVVIMKDLIFDPMLKVFEAREGQTTGAIEEAREMDEEALDLKQRLDSQTDEIRKEASNDREEIREQVKEIENALLDQARAEAAATIEQGQAKLEKERVAIQAELDKQRKPLAADIASKILGRPVQSSEVKA